MSTELIRPNWHVILIHYPLALLTVGLLIEVFSFLWRRSTLRTAGRWMILLGALLAIPAATTGLYAFRDVMVPGPAEPHTPWFHLVERSPWSAAQWRLMTRHVILAATGTGVVALALLVWLAVSDGTRRRAHWILVLVAVGGLGCLTAAAWYSGEAIYRHGTAVERPGADQPAAGEPADHHHHDHHDDDAADAAPGGGGDEGGMGLEDLFPPLQVHVLFAGLTVAAALVALGLSLHWWRRERGFRADELQEHLASVDPAAAALAARDAGVPVAGGVPPADLEDVEAAAVLGSTRTMPFPARYWLLALLLGAATYVTGLWQAEDWNFQVLGADGWHDEYRLAWHAVVGLVIAGAVLLLVLLTAFLRRWRLIGYLAALLLVLSVAAQVSLGTLILFDSSDGPLFHLRKPAAAAVAPTTRPATQTVP